MNAIHRFHPQRFHGLLRFSGRDPARRFWPYVGVVIALLFAAAGVTMSTT
jgi:hypothetical protein